MSEHTREKQYQRCIELRDTHGLTPLGLMTSQVWFDDGGLLNMIPFQNEDPHFVKKSIISDLTISGF